VPFSFAFGTGVLGVEDARAALTGSADDLRRTLTTLLSSGTRANHALNRLIDDYARFHVVLAVMASVFALAMGALAVISLSRYRSERRAESNGRFQRRAYFSFGLLGVVSSLGLALIAAANASNAGQPRVGLAGSVGILGAPKASTSRAHLNASFDRWLQTGRARLPATVQRHVSDRLAWQRPKAIVCAVLLVLAVSLSVFIWKRLLASPTAEQQVPTARRKLTMAAGVGAVAACFLLMLMVMGNTQAALAPLAMTLFYG
jgi:hypothetical protein